MADSSGVILPGVPVAVDRWTKTSGVHLFFLSHGHSDHTSGLSGNWNLGQIFCTDLTRKFIVRKFGLDTAIINVLEYDVPTKIPLDGRGQVTMTVTAIDANHVKGSAMFLFEGYFGTILCTGDFRYSPEMHDRLAKCDVHYLFLDNTYINNTEDLPSREEAMEMIIAQIVSYPPHYDVVFNLTSLGKEEIIERIAHHFRMPVRVSHERALWLVDIGIDTSAFTTDHDVVTRFSARMRNCVDVEAHARNGQRARATLSPQLIITPTAWGFSSEATDTSLTTKLQVDMSPIRTCSNSNIDTNTCAIAKTHAVTTSHAASTYATTTSTHATTTTTTNTSTTTNTNTTNTNTNTSTNTNTQATPKTVGSPAALLQHGFRAGTNTNTNTNTHTITNTPTNTSSHANTNTHTDTRRSAPARVFVQIPYTDHSTQRELLAFVKMVASITITPIVRERGGGRFMQQTLPLCREGKLPSVDTPSSVRERMMMSNPSLRNISASACGGHARPMTLPPATPTGNQSNNTITFDSSPQNHKRIKVENVTVIETIVIDDDDDDDDDDDVVDDKDDGDGDVHGEQNNEQQEADDQYHLDALHILSNLG